MPDRSIIPDLLKVILPGRRRIRKQQQAREIAKSRLQERLIAEYRSLAELPTKTGAAGQLGKFDVEGFREFIARNESSVAWSVAQSKVAPFHLPEMAGGVNPGDQRLIFHLVQYLQPRNILEVGTHIGASTIHILLGLLSLDGGDSARLTSVDIKDVNCEEETPWRQFGADRSPRDMVNCLKGNEIVRFANMSSVQYLKADHEFYDLIFLDGDHSASTVYQELPLALDRLAMGGMILLHDYFPKLQPLWPNGQRDSALMHADVIPGVCLALQRFIKEGNRVQVTPFGALPWQTKLSSNVTSLALVSKIACEPS